MSTPVPYDGNSLQNSFSVYKNALAADNQSFNASQFGSKTVGGKRRKSSKKGKRSRKSYKNGKVGKGRRTRIRV